MSFLKNTTTVCILLLVVIGLVIFFGVRGAKAKSNNTQSRGKTQYPTKHDNKPTPTKKPAEKADETAANAFRFR